MAQKPKRVIGTAQKAAKDGSQNEFSVNSVIPEKYQTAVSLVILFLLFLIFFSPMYFGGKTFQSGDIVTSKSLQKYVQNHDGGFTLWNPYVFCGMPSYAMAVEFKWFNLIYVGIASLKTVFQSIFSVEYATWTIYLILMSFTGFFLMKYKTRNTLVSLFSAVSLAFSTGLIVFLYLGHVTKLTSLCMYPLIFLMLFRFQEKIRLLDVAILTIALQLFVQGWHVQIVFYTFLAVAIYYIYFFIRTLVKKEKTQTTQLLKSAGVFAAAVIVALLIQSDNLTQIYEYTPYSTRGAKSVVENKQTAKEEPASGSEYYNYHTMWSFSPGEVMTFIIPSYYGFGNSTYSGPLTNNQETTFNTYFGQMESVDVAMYMGVLVFILALFAVITCWKDPWVQFLTIISVLGLLVSFGKNFSPVFDAMFYYFPYFDKFRVPSMILILVQMSMPFLAGLGLNKIISLKHEKDPWAEKVVKFAGIGFGVLFVVTVVLSGALKDSFISRMEGTEKGGQQIAYFKQYGTEVLNQYTSYAAGMFTADAMVAMGIIGIMFGLAYLYINSKLNRELLLAAAIVLTLTDLWRIDSRGAQYIQDQNIESVFVEPDYIRAIKDLKDPEPYRLISLKQDGSLGSVSNNADYHAAFGMQDIYGYSGVKPRAYQDYIDVLGTPANPTFLRMLNVKYIVMDKPANYPGFAEVFRSDKSVVYRYDQALPRVYFVNNIQTKPAAQVLNLVKNNSFDPKETAFLTEGSLTVDRPDSTAWAKVTSYKDEHIAIDAKASGKNLLFLGDTYFPKGWKARIDGQETEIYRVNHAFRGIVVPKGQHKIEFEYAPASFYISQKLSLVFSSLVVLGLFFGMFTEFKKKKQI
ncbi:MAG: YfhO family protein [Syntrophothermus sp.]